MGGREGKREGRERERDERGEKMGKEYVEMKGEREGGGIVGE
jgi:hypothetical protein